MDSKALLCLEIPPFSLNLNLIACVQSVIICHDQLRFEFLLFFHWTTISLLVLCLRTLSDQFDKVHKKMYLSWTSRHPSREASQPSPCVPPVECEDGKLPPVEFANPEEDGQQTDGEPHNHSSCAKSQCVCGAESTCFATGRAGLSGRQVEGSRQGRAPSPPPQPTPCLRNAALSWAAVSVPSGRTGISSPAVQSKMALAPVWRWVVLIGSTLAVSDWGIGVL